MLCNSLVLLEALGDISVAYKLPCLSNASDMQCGGTYTHTQKKKSHQPGFDFKWSSLFSLSFIICLSIPLSSIYPTQLILGFTPDPKPRRPPAEICMATRHFHYRNCVCLNITQNAPNENQT